MAGTVPNGKDNGDSDQRGKCDFGRPTSHGRPGSSGPTVDGAGRAVGFQVCTPPARDVLAALPAPADHRIVMSLALLGTVLPGGVVLEHAEAAAKSWPGFFEWLGRVADVRYCDAAT